MDVHSAKNGSLALAMEPNTAGPVSLVSVGLLPLVMERRLTHGKRH